jgi:hypothetical protein
MKAVGILIPMVFIMMVAPVFATQPENGDVNCDDALNVLDIVYMIDHKFKGGPAPCDFTSPGVAFAHYDSRAIDVGFTSSNLITVGLYAPSNGFANIAYSFYCTTDYCLELSLTSGVPRATSIVYEFTTDSPMSWFQTVSVVEGYNEIELTVRGCVREGDDKAVVNFNNINLSATFIPEYYGPREEVSGE